MTIDQYLTITGLSYFLKRMEGKQLNTIVKNSFQKNRGHFTQEELTNLYTYPVPKPGPGGTCSLTNDLAEQTYNLAQTLGLKSKISNLQSHHLTLRLWRLNQVVAALDEQTHIDWIGIYRKIEKSTGAVVLLKEAYRGRPSRAEFPLTEEFASHSNNSTVGLTGKGIVIQSIQNYNGPYYQCDAAVQSECCLPIINQNGIVTGIVDAESFHPEFFTQKRILNIVQVCRDLAYYDPTFS